MLRNNNFPLDSTSHHPYNNNDKMMYYSFYRRDELSNPHISNFHSPTSNTMRHTEAHIVHHSAPFYREHDRGYSGNCNNANINSNDKSNFQSNVSQTVSLPSIRELFPNTFSRDSSPSSPFSTESNLTDLKNNADREEKKSVEVMEKSNKSTYRKIRSTSGHSAIHLSNQNIYTNRAANTPSSSCSSPNLYSAKNQEESKVISSNHKDMSFLDSHQLVNSHSHSRSSCLSLSNSSCVYSSGMLTRQPSVSPPPTKTAVNNVTRTNEDCTHSAPSHRHPNSLLPSFDYIQKLSNNKNQDINSLSSSDSTIVTQDNKEVVQYDGSMGVPRYVCTTCDRSYSNLGNLRRHQREHDGKKTFRCPCCSRMFTRKSSMERHVKRRACC